jgi:hypothetical protein
MNKSTHFTGQPTFSQLINLIPKGIIGGCVNRHGSDRYYKTFTTHNHLICMLFACYGHCHSIREMVSGMCALEGKLQYSGLRVMPARSTFSEANARRDCKVFADIYAELKQYFGRLFPDSRRTFENLYIIDSTVIQLFQEIFKGSGCSKADGRRKGGLKVHMAVEAGQSSPSIVHISNGADNDKIFNKYVNLPMGSTVIMDRGYRDYGQYNLWNQQSIRWITRMHPHSYFVITKTEKVNNIDRQAGIKRVQQIQLGFPQKRIPKVICRHIYYRDPKSGKDLEFITNDLSSEPHVIADLYKKRWQIELLFKRLKQNMPLHYFLGDNQNAIKIQIWCALIADLLIDIILKQVKRKWAFSNVTSLIRLHLFNYLNLFSFLENPDKAIITTDRKLLAQLELRLSG